MKINGIDTADISVVLQGPADRIYTAKCIRSIRKYLPDAQIILSTWEDSETDRLDADRVILNKDPGCSFDDPEKERAFNINRWIRSSYEGVKAADRTYVLKCRTDAEILNTDFLYYWDRYPVREAFYQVAKHKILIPSPYTLRYLGDGKTNVKIETPFHISDWCCFGLYEDILHFTNCPEIQNLDAFARYYEKKSYYIPSETLWWMRNWLRKMAPEQYIGLQFAKRKFKNIEIKDFFTNVNFDAAFAEKFLVNNFIVLDPMQYGVIINKYVDFCKHIYILNDDLWNGMYRNYVYDQIYQKYYGKEQTKKIDILQVRHRMFLGKVWIKQMADRFWYPCLGIYQKMRYKLVTFIDREPVLYILVFMLRHVAKGWKVYKKITGTFDNGKQLMICPFNGTGDSYIIGNYLKYKGYENKYNLTVPREINKKILAMFGVKNVVVLKEKENANLQMFQSIMQLKSIKILHFDSNYEKGNIKYNLAAFKQINFADFYDYMVFGEKKPVPYQKIKPSTKIHNFAAFAKGSIQGRTVLLAPYSDSIDSLPIEDWEYIAAQLKKKGFSVFTNCGSKDEKPIKGSKAIRIPLDQIAVFVEWFGYFISVRSGLCDIVCRADCRKIIFYPKYIRYNYGKYINFFTLNLPERGSLAEEYEYKQKNNRKVINRMLDTLKEAQNTGCYQTKLEERQDMERHETNA